MRRARGHTVAQNMFGPTGFRPARERQVSATTRAGDERYNVRLFQFLFMVLAAEQQSGRAAEQQSSSAAAQQSSRGAEQSSRT